MQPNLPANPLSIELSFRHERLWWQIDDDDGQPELWRVSAGLWGLDRSVEDARHVATIDLAVAGLTVEPDLFDTAVLGEWAPEFFADAVIDPDRLQPDLEARIDAGPPRIVVLRRVQLAERWRGHGLGSALIASALRVMASNARFAACQVSPDELGGVRTARMLERIGFFRWRGVHVVGLRSAALLDVHRRLIDEWWPGHGLTHDA
ncbi:MAG TPA: hypothetical protein VJ870_09645 [Amycolatopsis sp.]|nr:hypothetical protein [Amycolatopsis sp.]